MTFAMTLSTSLLTSHPSLYSFLGKCYATSAARFLSRSLDSWFLLHIHTTMLSPPNLGLILHLFVFSTYIMFCCMLSIIDLPSVCFGGLVFNWCTGLRAVSCIAFILHSPSLQVFPQKPWSRRQEMFLLAKVRALLHPTHMGLWDGMGWGGMGNGTIGSCRGKICPWPECPRIADENPGSSDPPGALMGS